MTEGSVKPNNRRDEASNDYATRQVSFYHNLCRDEFKAGYDQALLDSEEMARGLVEALVWIADGCLVPPDGGAPVHGDAVKGAREALAVYRASKAL